MTKKSLAVSCVIDRGVQFQLQNSYLLYSLIKVQKLIPSQIYVHYIKGVKESYLSYLRYLGVNLIPVTAFDENNRYLNKLSQLKTELFKQYEFILLLDNDIFFCEKIDFTEIFPNKVSAKVVDRPNPTLEIFRSIYEHFKIPSFSTRLVNYIRDESELTITNNCNGGFYLFKEEFFEYFADYWIRMATELLENQRLLKEYVNHIDQVSFAVALDLLNLQVETLDSKYNFPTHLEFNHLLDQNFSTPLILHYHLSLDNNQLLKLTGISTIDSQIQKANHQIKQFHQENLQNAIFWDYRYQFHPELGSGIGSRGEMLDAKRKVLRDFSKLFNDLSVLEVGCGDLEVSSVLNFQNYLGIDLSEQAITTASLKRPDWKFVNTRLEKFSENQFDIVMCLDVLIHQPTQEDYWQLLKGLITRCRQYLIISGYAMDDDYFSSDITFYYGSLENHLKQFPQVVTTESVLEYRGLKLLICKFCHVPEQYNSYDISIQQLLWSVPNLPSSQFRIFRELLKLSYQSFNFVTSHHPRILEYPWVTEILHNLNPKNVLEIGAGINPIPLYLSEQGIEVITVDSHPLYRCFSGRQHWNEWGFLDYSQFESDISSFNLDFTQVEINQKFDAIFSVSVIEHTTSNTRRQILRKCKQLLHHRGFLILTVDLVPNSEKLWNLAEGKKVEDDISHGDSDDLLNELKSLNFLIITTKYWRNIPNSRTDVMGIVAQSSLSVLTRARRKLQKFF